MVCGTGHRSAVQMVGWRNYSMASGQSVYVTYCFIVFKICTSAVAYVLVAKQKSVLSFQY